MTLAIVTSYFNLNNGACRRRNYDVFRESLASSGLPLYTVEWAREPSAFELPEHDTLIRVLGGDCLWQTERLLNIGIQNLPAKFDNVAWVDADILVDQEDWPDLVEQSLRDWPIVQMFKTAWLMPPAEEDQVPQMEIPGAIFCDKQQVKWPDGRHRLGHSGFAWAARREMIQANGLYDAAPVGGGDKILLLGLLDQAQHPQLAERNNAAMQAHREDWMRRTRRACDNRVGYVDIEVKHLWHGTLESRQYHLRHGIPLKHNFDPKTDQAISVGGAWEWSSDKPDLHREVAAYLLGRDE